VVAVLAEVGVDGSVSLIEGEYWTFSNGMCIRSSQNCPMKGSFVFGEQVLGVGMVVFQNLLGYKYIKSLLYRGKQMAHKKTTGDQAASNAGKVLRDPNSTKAERSAAASALAQTRSKKKGRH
jgi:hypothetical protein